MVPPTTTTTTAGGNTHTVTKSHSPPYFCFASGELDVSVDAMDRDRVTGTFLQGVPTAVQSSVADGSDDLVLTLWASVGKGTSGLHFDEYYNTLYLLSGTKRVLLFSPEDTPHLYQVEAAVEAEDQVGPYQEEGEGETERQPASTRRHHHAIDSDVVATSSSTSTARDEL